MDEALVLGRKRWGQLLRLESSSRKREQKLKDFLRRKGVDFDTSSAVLDRILEEDEAIEEEHNDDDELEENAADPFDEVLELAQGRWRKLSRLEKNVRKRREKLKKFLMRRGIDFDTVSRVLEDESIAA